MRAHLVDGLTQVLFEHLQVLQLGIFLFVEVARAVPRHRASRVRRRRIDFPGLIVVSFVLISQVYVLHHTVNVKTHLLTRLSVVVLDVGQLVGELIEDLKSLLKLLLHSSVKHELVLSLFYGHFSMLTHES